MDCRRPPVAWSLVLPVAAAELALLVATANRYGYHRDELYFRVAAKHPAWGYDDQPALTPLLGRLSEWAFGDDPRGLRVVSAVAIAIVVVLVALIARELGAGRAGQAIAALATAASGAAMAVGHLLSTTTFDILVWVTVVLLVSPHPRRRRRAAVAARRPRRRPRAREQESRTDPARGPGLRLPHRPPLRPGAQPLVVGRRRARGSPLGAQPSLASAPRLAAARARRQDRQRGPDRQSSGTIAAAAAADRPAPRTSLDCRALVAPAPQRGATVSPARAGLPHHARGRLRRRWEAVLHDGPAARAARRGSCRRRATARGREDDEAQARGCDRGLRGCRGCDHAPARARRRSARNADPRDQRGRDRDGRLARPDRDGRFGVEPAPAGRAGRRGRLHGQLRRGRCRRPLRQRARRSSRLLGPQRVLALRPPSGRGRPDHRDRLRQPAGPPGQLQRLPARGPDRQRRRRSTTKSRTVPSGCVRPPPSPGRRSGPGCATSTREVAVSGRMWT